MAELVAFDATTGAVVWKHDVGGAVDTSAPAIANDVLYVASAEVGQVESCELWMR
jgi:outer membrane protein assembly factor BamB